MSEENTSMIAVVFEMKGQMNEVVHSVGRLTENVDRLMREVALSAHVSVQVEALKLRVDALETDYRERMGQVRLLKALPWTLFLAGAGGVSMLYKAWIS